MKSELVNFLLEHQELQWEMSGKMEEVLLKAIDEFFERYQTIEENTLF